MTREDILRRIQETHIIAILRGVPDELALPVAKALYDGGVRALEFTFEHEKKGYLEQNCEKVRRVKEFFRDQLIVGCGTVLSVEEVEKGAAAGAQIMISPNTDPEIIRRSRELGLLSMPGAMTSTEVVSAWKAGADMVKIFPAGTLGAAYMKDIQGPLGFIPMAAVGGIKETNLEQFLQMGVQVFGISGGLVSKEKLQNRDLAGITASAQKMTQILQQYMKTSET